MTNDEKQYPSPLWGEGKVRGIRKFKIRNAKFNRTVARLSKIAN
jgi:hypothetical protein